MIKEEIWKPVVGYEGIYEVSNHGNVKALERYVPYKRWGKAYKKKLKEKFLKPSKSLYCHTILSKDGDKEEVTIHRLVAEAFVENSELKCCVNHIDGNKLNNNAENLEWVTHSENHIHAADIGLKPTAERSHLTKFSREKITAVYEEYKNGGTNQKRLAIKYGISHTHVNRIVNQKTRWI